MPFSLPDNIPDAIKNLPVGAQRIWVRIFNSVHADTKDEDKARIAAWAAVKNKYEKVNDEWRKKAMETWHYIDLLEGIRFSDNENPTCEIQLFKIGEWKGHPTGGFKITEEIIEKMVENYEAGKRDVVVDYQHLSLDGGPDDARAAGWTKKLVNKGKDGLWAIVEWTKKAAEMIKEKEYRYISPEFHLNYPDKETKKKQGATLLAIALTNRPFLEGMAPVALSERVLAEVENSASLDEILGDINTWLSKSVLPLKGKKGSPAIRLYLKGVKEKLRELIKKSKATKSLAEQSLDDRRDKVGTAYRKRFVGMNEFGHWVNEVFETHVIAKKEDKFLKVPYTIKDDEVEFDDPVEVEQVYQEKGKTLAEKPMKTEDGVQFPAEAYAYVPDSQKPSTWKLRLWEDPSKKETAKQVGAAIAAFSPGGFRGQKVQIPTEDRGKVKAKIRAAWKRVNPDKEPEDMPAHIKSTEGGEEMDRKLLCAQLGLSETATDDEITAELKRLKELQGHKALIESLGLTEQATEQEVLEAVTKLKEAGSQAVAEGTVKLAEFNQLKNDHAETKKLAEGLKKDKDALNMKLLEKERDEVIGKALTDGKLVPANQELWEKQYMANPEETKALLEVQPVVLDFKEHGSGGGAAIGNAGEQIAQKCKEKQATDSKLSYNDALKAVQLENPVLAKEYAKEIRV